MEPALKIEGLSKTFNRTKKALNNIEFDVAQGEMVALIGSSGSGKSTLLRHISGLTTGDKGVCCIKAMGMSVQENGKLAKDIRRLRSDIGFIFQQFNIVGRLTVLDNVLTGMLGQVPRWRGTLGRFSREEKHIALSALERVGLLDQAYQRASTLSGGQQQRVAIARTLVQKPKLVLADEPIASLDPESARRVMALLESINKDDGITVIVSLHQVDYALRYCSRVVALRDGELFFDGPTADIDKQFFNDLYGTDIEHDDYSKGLIGTESASKGLEKPKLAAASL